MQKIRYYVEKYKIQISILLLLFVLLFILTYKEEKHSDKEGVAILEGVELKNDKEEEIKEIEKIKVDIKGAVVNPGVYEFDINSRVQDAINKAGGLSENANIEYINLSKKLKDEMVIIIYTNEFIDNYNDAKEEVIYIKYECECPDKTNDACILEEDVLNDTESIVENQDDKDNLISINSASLEDLMKLNGIGESKAKSIIEYREQNGGFNSIEEIMNVSGIGESAYSKIKDYIKL